MRHFLIFIFFLLAGKINCQQVIVKDSISKMHIPYVAITFGHDNGFYSNSEGMFELNDVIGDTLTLYSIGYKKKTILKKDITANTINLVEDELILEEVVISNKPKKFKTEKVKPERHNDFLDSHRLIIGDELAVYIPNHLDSKDIEIKSLLIPIVNKTISFDKDMVGKKQRVKKLPFSALYKVCFYKNDSGKPGGKIEHKNITVILDEKSTLVELDVEKYNIELPLEGIFVSIINLGKVDENNKLISETPFQLKNSKNGLVKIAKPTKPFFPVCYSGKVHKTFYRYTFEENEDWKIFYKHKNVKQGEFHNISFGYELKIYDN
jgi:hypothetical protein